MPSPSISVVNCAKRLSRASRWRNHTPPPSNGRRPGSMQRRALAPVGDEFGLRPSRPAQSRFEIVEQIVADGDAKGSDGSAHGIFLSKCAARYRSCSRAASDSISQRVPRHCERSEAIHPSASEVAMDCFASLAMTLRDVRRSFQT